MDYNFTADIEKELDAIADGSLIWSDMLGKFTSHFIKMSPSYKKMQNALMVNVYLVKNQNQVSQCTQNLENMVQSYK